MRLALTDLAIRKLSHPVRGQITCWDEHTPGFGVRLSQRTKSFVVIRGRERRLTTIGAYPSKSLSEARGEAKRLLAEKPSRSRSIIFSDAKEAYLEEAEAKLRPATYREYERYLNLIDFNGRLADLTRAKIKEDVDNPHGIVAVKVFLNWCVRFEHLEKNPLAPDRQERRKAKKKRVLTPDEIKLVWAYEDGDFSNIVKLLLLLGQRRTETSLVVEEWMHDGDLITIPDTVTKNHEEHTFPYGNLAARYLPPNPFRGWSKAKARMDKVIQIPHWTLHDLRRTFVTIHAQIGTPIHVREKLVNHISGESFGGVAGIYDQYNYLPEMRSACEKYEAYLQSILSN
jgi:integrase